MDMLRADGVRRLLCDDLGCRPDAWGRRSGRGIEACRGVDEGEVDDTWPTEACAEPYDDAEMVRSRGNGRESRGGTIPDFEGVFKLDRDGIRRADRPLPELYDHVAPSSSPTGVKGIATLEPEALEGVAIPASSFKLSTSCSRI